MAESMARVGIAVVGPGLVGRLVLDQLSSDALQPHFELVSVSNSRHTVVRAPKCARELSAHELCTALPSSRQPLDAEAASSGASFCVLDLGPSQLIKTLVQRASETKQHIILIDCTASDTYPLLYPQAISSGLSVVTPNKVAFSSTEALYRSIVEAQSSSPLAGLCYFEGACGAGLPVCTTIRDLVRTGDEIVKIEAVLSGTMSYIFNQYSAVDAEKVLPRAFSEIVREAHEHGHAEPHPAEDLSGRDVARKLAILARLSSRGSAATFNLAEGHSSIPTESLVPDELVGEADPQAFVAGLAAHDDRFDRLRQQAAAAGTVLRFVGVLDHKAGSIQCGLRQFPPSHPFATLSGSHLSFAIYTKRYSATPLVIQGPGYPVEVTAAAVVSDAIRVAERFGSSFGL